MIFWTVLVCQMQQAQHLFAALFLITIQLLFGMTGARTGFQDKVPRRLQCQIVPNINFIWSSPGAVIHFPPRTLIPKWEADFFFENLPGDGSVCSKTNFAFKLHC